VRRTLVPFFLRDPDAPVVAKRLAHQSQLGLMLACDRDAGRVNLRVTGIAERSALLVGAPDGRCIAALRIRRQIEDVTVPTGRQDHCIAKMRLDSRPSPCFS
jgi:hypothetical protein